MDRGRAGVGPVRTITRKQARILRDWAGPCPTREWSDCDEVALVRWRQGGLLTGGGGPYSKTEDGQLYVWVECGFKAVRNRSGDRRLSSDGTMNRVMNELIGAKNHSWLVPVDEILREVGVR
jgi:hypothetical protein